MTRSFADTVPATAAWLEAFASSLIQGDFSSTSGGLQQGKLKIIFSYGGLLFSGFSSPPMTFQNAVNSLTLMD
jgi:hypothetical protein